MKTSEFLQTLQANQEKSLLFQYMPNQLVGANYHITEVKNIMVESVDCGARSDSWNETVIQLWESPSEIGKTEYMTAYKALAILKKVDRMRAMDQEAEVKFEYGNALFHTAQLFVNDFEIKGSNLIVNLAVTKTDCKAKEDCGIPETVSSESASAACLPGSGCC
ncbi:DUF6428 family protein [Sungkyunkwania multivorans]|uniref:DUF6428 family protein n=1 Tax=Sungkyunkwania multivorans TaxID=1173618 RepID=A0ABW3CTN7_9FLAO